MACQEMVTGPSSFPGSGCNSLKPRKLPLETWPVSKARLFGMKPLRGGVEFQQGGTAVLRESATRCRGRVTEGLGARGWERLLGRNQLDLRLPGSHLWTGRAHKDVDLAPHPELAGQINPGLD
jgi:hypothetical protein